MRAVAPLLIAALLILGGCKKSDPDDPVTSPTAATASKTPGMQEFKLEHLSISVPEDWTTLNLTTGEFDKALNAGTSDPEREKVAKQVRTLAANKAYKLFAADRKHVSNGFADNVNVLELNAPAGMTFPHIVQVNRAEVAGMGTIDLDKDESINGQTWHMWTCQVPASQSHVPLTTFLYLTLHDGRMEVVTFAAQRSHAESIRKVADASVGTIAFR